MEDFPAIAAFYASRGRELHRRPDGRAARLEGLRRRRRRLGAHGLRRLGHRGEGHRRLRRPGRAEQAAALPRARDRLAVSSPASRAAATPPRPPAPPAPSPTARSAGTRRSATSIRGTTARSPSPAASAAPRTGGRVARPRRHRLPPPRPGGAPMTRSDAIRRAADLLRGHRESIDRLDAILVFTLAERFKHTQAVGVLKARARPAPLRSRTRERADRPPRTPGRGSRPRRRVRPQIPELHHLGSHQAPREPSRKRAHARPPTQGD